MTLRLRTLGVVFTLVIAACAGGSTTDTNGGTTPDGETTTTTAGTTTTTAPATTTTTLDLPDPTLWVSDSNNGIVYSINPMGENDILGQVEVGSGAESIVFGAGSVWVVGNRDGAVYRLDPETLDLEATIPVGENTAGIVFTDGLVYASSFGTGPDFVNTVHIIDPATNAVIETVDAGAGGTGMAEGSALGAAFESGQVYRITSDGGGGFGFEIVDVAHGLSELASADLFVFVTGIGDGMLYRLDGESLAVIDSTPLGVAPNFIVYDGAGRVWVTDSSGGSLWSVDIDTLEAVEETFIPTPTGLSFGVIDGKTWLFVASFTNGVYRIDPIDPAGSMTHIFTAAEGGGLFDVAFGNGG